jgi:hypothetical protein
MPFSAADLSTLSRLLDEALDLPVAEFEAWLQALPAEHGASRKHSPAPVAWLSIARLEFLETGHWSLNDRKATESVGPERISE